MERYFLTFIGIIYLVHVYLANILLNSFKGRIVLTPEFKL